jgi:hypothetical protein
MTSRQRWILIDLVLINVLLFCCIGSIALLLLTQPPGQDPLQSAVGAFQNPFSTSPPAAPNASSNLVGTPEAGWKSYSNSVDRFAISMPIAWKQIPVNPAAVASDLDLAGRQNPELYPPGAQGNSIAASIKFIGIDSAPDAIVGSFKTNVNVIHRSQLIQAPLDVYVPISLKALQDLPTASKPILHRRVLTFAGEAEEFSYHNTVRLSNQPDVATTNRQYVLVLGKEFFIINCTAPLRLEDRYVPLFEKIAASFRWIGN